jgi:hypothetical protein
LATIPTSAHELQDTESDTMDEVDRDKLNKVGQATIPTHGTLGLDSNDLWGPGECFNLMILGYSDSHRL